MSRREDRLGYLDPEELRERLEALRAWLDAAEGPQTQKGGPLAELTAWAAVHAPGREVYSEVVREAAYRSYIGEDAPPAQHRHRVGELVLVGDTPAPGEDLTYALEAGRLVPEDGEELIRFRLSRRDLRRFEADDVLWKAFGERFSDLVGAHQNWNRVRRELHTLRRTGPPTRGFAVLALALGMAALFGAPGGGAVGFFLTGFGLLAATRFNRMARFLEALPPSDQGLGGRTVPRGVGLELLEMMGLLPLRRDREAYLEYLRERGARWNLQRRAGEGALPSPDSAIRASLGEYAQRLGDQLPELEGAEREEALTVLERLKAEEARRTPRPVRGALTGEARAYLDSLPEPR